MSLDRCFLHSPPAARSSLSHSLTRRRLARARRRTASGLGKCSNTCCTDSGWPVVHLRQSVEGTGKWMRFWSTRSDARPRRRRVRLVARWRVQVHVSRQLAHQWRVVAAHQGVERVHVCTVTGTGWYGAPLRVLVCPYRVLELVTVDVADAMHVCGGYVMSIHHAVHHHCSVECRNGEDVLCHDTEGMVWGCGCCSRVCAVQCRCWIDGVVYVADPSMCEAHTLEGCEGGDVEEACLDVDGRVMSVCCLSHASQHRL